jgi:hypothetical protein
MTAKLEHEWEIELPAATAEQLLAALTTRDRLYGQSITLEPEDDPAKAVEVWLASVESLDGAKYRLDVYAEISGPKEFLEAARDALQDIVSEQVEAAAAEAGEATLVETKKLAEIEFRKVEEDDERPSLVIPEWLAPGEIEVPWGFRSYDPKGGAWPDDDTINAHDRLVIIPFDGRLLLYALPPIEDDEDDEDDEE